MEIRWLIFYVIEPFKSGSILNYQIHTSKSRINHPNLRNQTKHSHETLQNEYICSFIPYKILFGCYFKQKKAEKSAFSPSNISFYPAYTIYTKLKKI
ncbi:hypothetical protein A3Q35_18300 [Aeribacillus pallidus]|nr:hypothetical protein A3Q35_18300 [Aeribacillus pallidus]